MNTVTTETLKGQPHHSVVIDGKVVAEAWPVQVQARIFTVKVRGSWRGVMPEVDVVKYLEDLDLTAAMDRSAMRTLLGI